MTNYLLALILLALCLGGVPLDAKVKQVIYVALAIVGIFIALTGAVPSVG